MFMAAILQPRSGGGVSLEFMTSDAPFVRRAVTARYGDPGDAWLTAEGPVSFGEETFVHDEDWDEHCLASQTDRGAAMLEALHLDLGGD